MKKRCTSVYFDPEQLEKLKWISEKTGVPMAKMVRDAIDTQLEKMLKEKGWDISLLQEKSANALQ